MGHWGAPLGLGNPVGRATPCASVAPFQSARPLQSNTVTWAARTGWALSSVVTQTSELARPHLKWAARLVTRAPAGTYMGLGLPRRAAPSRALSISTR